MEKSKKDRGNRSLIHGIINIALPFIVVASHNGVLDFFYNRLNDKGLSAWDLIWVAYALIFVPIISSVIGVIIGGVRMKKSPSVYAGIGTALSFIAIILQILFRFVLLL